MEIIQEEFSNVHEAKDILKQREKQRDLVYEQKICLEYLEKVSGLNKKELEEIIKELQKISILKPRYIALILNMMPDTEEEVEALFSKEMTKLKKEEVKQIADIVKKYNK